MDSNNQPTPTTMQLAELLVTKLNDSKTPKAAEPEVAFSIKITEGNSVTFEHFKDEDLAVEAFAFCARYLESMESGECKSQIMAAAQQMAAQQVADKAPQQAQRNVVFSTPVNIDGNELTMSIAENENGEDASAFFCKSLTFQGGKGLTGEEMGVCTENVTRIANAAIGRYMEQQTANAAPKKPEDKRQVYSVPLQLADQEIPLGFILNESPVLTTARFCRDNWDYISTILTSDDPNVAISEDMCVDVLLTTVNDMVVKTLSAPEGKALVQAAVVLTVPIETDAPGGKTVAYNLDILDGQTSSEAVDFFLRATGVDPAARQNLVEAVDGKIRERNAQLD